MKQKIMMSLLGLLMMGCQVAPAQHDYIQESSAEVPVQRSQDGKVSQLQENGE